jgi:type IV pilus assembly protein PilF
MSRGQIAVLALAIASCKHVPTEAELRKAQIHYDLGVQTQMIQPQEAFKSYQRALEIDPNFTEAHNAIGLVLHLAFQRPEEAIVHYKKAIELRPTFSEAKTNLANVYLDQKRYDEAIALYDEALNDMLYPTPFIAHGNSGWALYEKGDKIKAIERIKTAITLNPKFCLGYRNLGTIYEREGSLTDACKQFARFREHCPDQAEAHYREGICLSKLGQTVEAKARFASCASQEGVNAALKDDCLKLGEQLGP